MARICIFNVAIMAFALTLFFAPNNLTADEPTFEQAQSWWPPMQNVWTPVGWKDHMFRFNVLYNGSVLASPHVILMWTKPATQKYIDKGIMLVPTLAVGDVCDVESQDDYIFTNIDGGVGNQGWNYSHQAPVLWTELKKDGFVVQQEIFPHMQGGNKVQTGIEPIFAWIKYVVKDVPQSSVDGEVKLRIQLSSEFALRTSMIASENMLMKADRRDYHGRLEETAFEKDNAKGSYILEENKNVRLVCMPSTTAEYKLTSSKPDSKDYVLEIAFKAKKGAEAVLLLPMLSYEKDVVSAEMEVGIKKAMTESDKFWQKEMATKTVVDVPQQEINRLIRYSVLQALTASERDPDSGYYTLLTGSGSYDTLWVTPTSYGSHMLLDQLGYYKDVAFMLMFSGKRREARKHLGLYMKKTRGISVHRQQCLIFHG